MNKQLMQKEIPIAYIGMIQDHKNRMKIDLYGVWDMIVSVWSERVRNSVSKWLAEDVCILHGIMEIKNIAMASGMETVAGDNAGNKELA